MLKHAKTSAKSDGADATLVQPSDWNADHVIDSDGAKMATRSDTPSAPAAGNLQLYGSTAGGGALPATIPPSGGAFELQPFMGRKRIDYFMPIPAATGWNTGSFFGLSPNTVGTGTGRTPATTNLFSSLARIGWVSSTSANNRAVTYGQVRYWRGNAAKCGGFRCVFRFGISDASLVSAANMFVGLSSTSSVGSGGAEVTTVLNAIGVGCNSGETELSLITNDGTGTATKTSLGTSFPCNTTNTDVYELVLYAAPNASEVSYKLLRINTGDVTSGTVSSDLPVNTQFMTPIFMRGNMGTAAAVGIDVVSFYGETEY
jgi:hypothetical protein